MSDERSVVVKKQRKREYKTSKKGRQTGKERERDLFRNNFHFGKDDDFHWVLREVLCEVDHREERAGERNKVLRRGSGRVHVKNGSRVLGKE